MNVYKRVRRISPLKRSLQQKWADEIIREKGYSILRASCMSRRIEQLIKHIQCGHAVIAYYRQDGTFKLAKATLLPYKKSFRREFCLNYIHHIFLYWDVEEQAWRTFRLSNFLEWRPVC